MSKDFYKILGVERSATADEIKKAYRKLAHKYHPDKEGGDEAKFKMVNEAYQVLSKPEKRQAYDQFGEAGVNGPSGAPGGGFGGWEDIMRQANAQGGFQGGVEFDLGDIFNEFFGGGRRRQMRGADIQMDVQLTFEEAAFGKTIEVQPQSKKLEVKIPGGIENGQSIRVNGEGQPAPQAEGRPGDLFVRVHVKQRAGWERQGADVYSREEIPFSTLALGGTYTVETLDGDFDVKVPSGTTPGKLLRIKGKGANHLHGGGRGNHIIQVQVQVPKNPHGKLKKLLKQLGENGL